MKSKKMMVFLVAFVAIVCLVGYVYVHIHQAAPQGTAESTSYTAAHEPVALKEVLVKDYGVVELTDKPFEVSLHDGPGRFRPDIRLTQSGVGMRMHYQALDINDKLIAQGDIGDNDWLDLSSPMGKEAWKIILTRVSPQASIICKLYGLR